MNRFDEHLAGYRKSGMEYLSANVPEIKRIEALEDFSELTFIKDTDAGEVLMLQYEAKAPSLFPYVRQSLIDKGVAKKHNMIRISKKNEGTPEEIYNVLMGFYGIALQISIDVHK